MPDNLAIIRRTIDEHQAIRGHVKLIGDSVADQEALRALERVRSDWIPGQLEALAERRKKLQRAVSSLDEGLENHFAQEEKALPPLLGELFMRALMLDHQEIRQAIDDAKVVAAEIKLEGLSREELLDSESRIQEAIDSLCHLVEDHAAREEIILEMLQRALEERAE